MSNQPTRTNPILQLVVMVYPAAMLGIGVALNYYVFKVNPLHPVMLSEESLNALIIALTLLLLNHTWLMTTTELTRAHYGMCATPEEWVKSGSMIENVSPKGIEEVQRRHNAHRNATENIVYFALAALIFVFASPSQAAVYVWIVGFAVARLAYTASYLAGSDSLRGLFMSLGLICLYGIASYLTMSVFL